MTATTKTKKHSGQSQEPAIISVLSIVFGVVSLLGPGLFLGIPAIILASIALKKDAPGRGLSIAGLVTGICSTVLSLLLAALLTFLVAWAVNNPGAFDDSDYYYPQSEQLPGYQGART